MAHVAQGRRRLLPHMSFASGWGAWMLRHAWVLPIVLVALWLRASGMSQTFLYGDEAEYGIVARYLSRDPTYLAYPAIEGLGAQPFVSQPPLVLYTMALSMRILGATDVAALLPSLLFGVASVVAVYAIGYRLGGRLVGLSAAALLAVLPFHVLLSRKAMLDTGYTFFLILTAYFLVAWLQERRTRQAVGVGIAAACCALSKLPGALAPIVAALVFAYALAIAIARRKREPEAVRRTLVHGAWGALPVVVGAGLYLGLLAYLNALGNLSQKLGWQLGRVDQSLAIAPDPTLIARPASWYFTDPQFSFAVLLGSLVLTLAIAGLVVGILRFARHPVARPDLLVVPLMTAVVLGFFLYSQRKEGFYLLPFALLGAVLVAHAADGLRAAVQWGSRRAASLARRAVPIAIAGAVLLVAFPAVPAATQSYDQYALGNTPEKYFGYGTKDAALYIHDHDPGAMQYGTLLGRFSLYWYNEQPTAHWYMGHAYIEQQIQAGHLKYVVYDDYLGLAFDRTYMQDLINRYHGQVVQTYAAGWGEVKLVELHPEG